MVFLEIKMKRAHTQGPTGVKQKGVSRQGGASLAFTILSLGVSVFPLFYWPVPFRDVRRKSIPIPSIFFSPRVFDSASGLLIFLYYYMVLYSLNVYNIVAPRFGFGEIYFTLYLMGINIFSHFGLLKFNCNEL